LFLFSPYFLDDFWQLFYLNLLSDLWGALYCDRGIAEVICLPYIRFYVFISILEMALTFRSFKDLAGFDF